MGDSDSPETGFSVSPGTSSSHGGGDNSTKVRRIDGYFKMLMDRRKYPVKDSSEVTDIPETMQLRYNKITSIGNYDGQDPLSYCYIEDNGKMPSAENHHKITYSTSYSDSDRHFQVVPLASKNLWKHLPPCKKKELFHLLGVIGELEKSVHYRTDTGKWSRRETSINQDVSQGESFHLQAYGNPDSSGSSLMDVLEGDESIETMVKELKERTTVSPTITSMLELVYDIYDSWREALLNQMTDGTSKTALTLTLNCLRSLVNSMPESEVPRHLYLMVVKQFSSPIYTDSFSISDCCPKAVTRSSSSVSSKSISRSESSSADDRSLPKTCSAIVKKSDKKCCRSRRKRIWSGLPVNSRQNIDLAVVCCDKKSSDGKYILLVEVYSHGESYSAAVGKFKKAIVHVLQGQTEVFGLFISSSRYDMFRAKRNLKTQEISFYQASSNLFTDLTQSTRHVYVLAFQRLLMDIFTCFAHGMLHIKIAD